MVRVATLLTCALAVERKHTETLPLRLLSSECISYSVFATSALHSRAESTCFEAGVVRIGIGFGNGVHSAKALQIALSTNEPRLSADADGKVPGFGLSFNVSTLADHERKRKANPHTGEVSAVLLDPDDPHESNHGEQCRKRFAGSSTYKQLNVNSHEQNHGRRKHYLPSPNNLKLDRFSFCVTLLNELENERINRRTMDRAVGRVSHHDRRNVSVCCLQIWTRGRCFCLTPLIRSFDDFGRLVVSSLPRS